MTDEQLTEVRNATIDSMYHDTELTDEEWQEIDEIRSDGRGVLTLEPKRLPLW